MFRWLRSPSALLYDPALRRTLNGLMKKLFLQLMSEFKRLGAVIVHANYNQIIVCTKKRRIVDAITYVDYVMNTIKSNDLFHGIELTYKQCWQLLMWLDTVSVDDWLKKSMVRSLI